MSKFKTLIKKENNSFSNQYKLATNNFSQKISYHPPKNKNNLALNKKVLKHNFLVKGNKQVKWLLNK